MSNQEEIRSRLIKELEDIRQQIAQLEIVDSRRKRAEKYWAEAMAILVGKLGVNERRN